MSPRILNRSLIARAQLLTHGACGPRLLSTSVTSHHSSSFVLSHPASVDNGKTDRGRVIAVTSGKGGVGKTTVSANFALGLASRGHKTCVVDFDIGLRNLVR
jgi:Mrp family chromosome partitioning ATPase